MLFLRYCFCIVIFSIYWGICGCRNCIRLRILLTCYRSCVCLICILSLLQWRWWITVWCINWLFRIVLIFAFLRILRFLTIVLWLQLLLTRYVWRLILFNSLHSLIMIFLDGFSSKFEKLLIECSYFLSIWILCLAYLCKIL